MRHNPKHNRILTFIAAAALAAAWASGPAASAMASTSVVVDDTLTECPTANYTDIQSAIDSFASGSGGTITVCKGTYPGALLIMNHPGLKLIAKDTAIIRPLVGGDIGYTAPLDGALVTVQDSANVTIQGFAIDGWDGFDNAGSAYGIHYLNSTGTITKNFISRIRHSPMDTANTGRGIWVDDGVLPTLGMVNITSNSIADYQRYGMWVQGNIKPNISKNALITSKSANNQPTGMMINGVKGGSVKGNTVRADWNQGEAFVAFGIIITDTSNLSASANMVAGVAQGFNVWATCTLGQTVGNKIVGNKVYDANDGIAVTGDSSGCGAGADNTQVTSNKLIAFQYWQLPEAGVNIVGGANAKFTKATGNTIYGYSANPVLDSGMSSIISPNKVLTLPPAGPQ